MLKSQQELLKLSELREKINTHPADGDTEKLGEYTTEAIDVERRYRAAVVVEAEAEARAEVVRRKCRDAGTRQTSFRGSFRDLRRRGNWSNWRRERPRGGVQPAPEHRGESFPDGDVSRGS